LVETFVNGDERLQARGKRGEDHLGIEARPVRAR
jgi:hypothetical protein